MDEGKSKKKLKEFNELKWKKKIICMGKKNFAWKYLRKYDGFVHVDVESCLDGYTKANEAYFEVWYSFKFEDLSESVIWPSL